MVKSSAKRESRDRVLRVACEDNIQTADPSSGPILIHAGLQDIEATPEEVSCIVDKLIEDGVTPQVCTDATADHWDIVQRSAAFAVQWALALAAGDPLPPCTASELPPCE